ncbi:MAG: type II toxin-antitoxin system RelE/ParE family toxin, partial [Candidatus Sulfotelmatobacter sp.]
TREEKGPGRCGSSSTTLKPGMAYLVNITARAQQDLAQLYDDLNAPGSDSARRWYTGLKRSILGLEEFPKRCAATPENRKLRHLLYGDKPHVYRVIYRVLEKQRRVEILHVRHGARQSFKRPDLEVSP